MLVRTMVPQIVPLNILLLNMHKARSTIGQCTLSELVAHIRFTIDDAIKVHFSDVKVHPRRGYII